MRLLNLRFRGLTRFRSVKPIEINFAALGGGLIALVGRTGAGKTTAMEAVPALLYQRFPTRPGSLYEWTAGADAFIEATFKDGDDTIMAELLIDAAKKAMEGHLFVNGHAIAGGGRLGDYGTEIERLFGTRDLFLAAPFAAQNKAGNFLFLPKAKRKELFIEMLAMGKLEQIAKRAALRRAEADREVETYRALVEQQERALLAKPGLEQELRNAESMVSVVQGRLAEAIEVERAANAACEAARTAQAELARLTEKEQNIKNLVASNDAAHSTAVRSEADARSMYESQVSQLRIGLAELDETALQSRQNRTRQGLTNQIAGAEKTLTEEPAIKLAADQIPGLDQTLQALRLAKDDRVRLEGDLRDANHALQTSRSALTTAREHRTNRLADLDRRSQLLKSVPCTAEPLWFTGAQVKSLSKHGGSVIGTDLRTCPLLTDAQVAAGEAEQLRKLNGFTELEAAVLLAERKVDQVQATLADSPIVTREQLSQHEEQLLSLRQVAARATVMAQARATLTSVREEQSFFEASCTRELDDLKAQKERGTQRLTTAEADMTRVLSEHATALRQLQSAVANSKLDLSEASAALQDARQRLPDHRSAMTTLENAVRARQGQETTLRGHEQTVIGFAARLEQLNVGEAELLRLKSEREVHIGRAADCSLIEEGFGKEGIQALEIDAAGPLVSDLTNQLLEACFGPQFSISLPTLRAKKTKGKTHEFTEAFDVLVFTEGKVRPVEGLSGGEKVIIGEAIGLAIAIFNARRSGIHWETLFRDETAGSLDQLPNEDGLTTADAYVLMLRKALELGPFHQVVFAAHQPAVFSAADVQLLVGNGTIQLYAGAERAVA